MTRFQLRRTFLLFCSAVVIGVGSYFLGNVIVEQQQQLKTLQELQAELSATQAQNQVLEDELKRLEDPIYAQQVARSKYSVSSPKEGQYVFVLPQEGA